MAQILMPTHLELMDIKYTVFNLQEYYDKYE